MVFCDSIKWAAHIKARCAKQGRTLQDLLTAAAISRSSWQEWRSGARSPTMRSVAKIERVVESWESSGGF